MINKKDLLTKTDGTKVCRIYSSNKCYLCKISNGERLLQVVCDENEISNYIETSEKIDLVAFVREKMQKLSKNK